MSFRMTFGKVYPAPQTENDPIATVTFVYRPIFTHNRYRMRGSIYGKNLYMKVVPAFIVFHQDQILKSAIKTAVNFFDVEKLLIHFTQQSAHMEGPIRDTIAELQYTPIPLEEVAIPQVQLDQGEICLAFNTSQNV